MRYLKHIDWIQFLVLFFVIIYAAVVFLFTQKSFGEQHFSFLSLSFLKGNLDLNSYPWGWNDCTLFSGNYYWPLGPFPAILHLPFTYIAKSFGYMIYQKNIQWMFVFLTFYLIYKIAEKLNYSRNISILWSFAFCVGSVFFYVSLVPFGWYFSHVITTLLIFAALYEYFGKKRHFLIGVLYAAIFLTRATAVLGILFFAYSIFSFEKYTLKIKVKHLLELATPVIFGLFLMGIYNLLRFGSTFEQGYSYQLLGEELTKARSYGIFSLIHIPGNLYYLFLASPIPVLRDGLSRVLIYPYIHFDLWGLGIFYTSPYFLKLFTLRFKNNLSKGLLATTLLISVPIILYYGIGANQYGYRYSLDFLPYLYLILILEHQKTNLSKRFIFLLLFSIVFNPYLIFSRV